MRYNSVDFNLYHPEIKELFFKAKYDDSTRNSLLFIFKKCAEMERILNKDVYEFNQTEFEDLLMNFGSNSESSVASRMSIVRSYIDFALDQGFDVPNGCNLLYTSNFSGEDAYKKFISKVAETRKILTTEQLDYLIDDFCVNDQDSAVFSLLCEGARGRQEEENALEEIINLKIEDCNFETNDVTLTRNNGKTRTIKVSDKTMSLLKDANAQDKFIRKNGEASDWAKAKKNDRMLLYQNGYIFKPTRKGFLGKINAKTIVQRIGTIKELYGNPFISVTNIWLSGMVEYGKKIKQEKGKELDREDYKEICNRFGHGEVYWSKIKSRISKYI